MTAAPPRRAALPAAVLALAALAAACRGPAGQSSRLITPPAPDGSVAAAPAGSAAEGELAAPIVGIEAADRVVAVLNADLDGDVPEEQLVAVQRRDDPAAPVRLLLADPGDAAGRYARVVWESPTSSVIARLFRLSVEDLVGDHGREIIASGMNEEGRFTLDVFRRIPPGPAVGLAFAPVCQIAADEIRIVPVARPDAYDAGTKNGASFPIVASLRDPDSGNPMDLIRITWSWSYGENRYVPGPPEKVPGEQVGQAQLQQLFADLRPEAFESFLDGLWVSGPGGGRSKVQTMVEFRVRDRRIAVGTADTLEIFLWRETLRTLPDRVIIVAENEAVRKIARTFSARATGASDLALDIRENDSGTTEGFVLARAAEPGAAPAARGTPPAAAPTAAALPAPIAARPLPSGEYTGATGIVLRFSAATITWVEGGRERTGAWVVFPLGGRDVLTVRFSEGRQVETRSWLLDQGKRLVDGARPVRTLTLSPIVVSVRGWEEGTGDPLTFVQVAPAPSTP